VRDDKKLTARQERFIDHYLENGGNSAAAARQAGYAEGSAKVTGCRLLTKANLKQTIEGKRTEMSQNSEDRRAKWISHLEHLALSAKRESDQLRAVETLIKAEGWAQPEKSEVVTYSGNFLADLSLDEPIDEVEAQDPGLKPIEINDLH
jgi:phage terminase small subunit